MGNGLRQLKLPSADALRRGLTTIKNTGIPLLVVTGGWNPAFEAVAEVVSEVGNGRHVVINSDHHFPHLVSEAFNDLLAEFMTAAVRR